MGKTILINSNYNLTRHSTSLYPCTQLLVPIEMAYIMHIQVLVNQHMHSCFQFVPQSFTFFLCLVFVVLIVYIPLPYFGGSIHVNLKLLDFSFFSFFFFFLEKYTKITRQWNKPNFFSLLVEQRKHASMENTPVSFRVLCKLRRGHL